MARDEELSQCEKPAFSLGDLDSGKIALNPGWLNEVWDKWPGDESIGELLAVLDGDSLERKSIDKE